MSVAILENVIGVPHELAVLGVNPLRIFSFFCVCGEYSSYIVI